MIRVTIKTTASGLVSVLCLFIFMAAMAHGAVPQYICYQGKLVDAAGGDPLDGPVEMTFRIFDAYTDGHLLWEETHVAVVLEDGVYDITLGGGITTVGAFDEELFLDSGRWLEVAVAVGTAHPETFTPRQPVVSVAFAFKASDADTLGGMESSEFLTGSDSVGGDLSGQLENPTVSGVQGVAVSRTSPATGQVMKYTGSAWAPGTDNDSGGDITEVKAGGGLAGGGTSGGVSLDVGAGTGIWVAANEIALDITFTDARYVNEGQADAVTAAMIADGAVGTSQIAEGSIRSGHLMDGAALSEILDDDGPGSSLDADTLDGKHATEFGDILGIAAGMGLSGGGVSGNVTLDVVGGTGISVVSDAVQLNTAYTDIRYVNSGGDTLTGDLTINADLSVTGISSTAGDHTAAFESSGGAYASAIKGVANATTGAASGLDLAVTSVGSNATGVAVDVNASNLNGTGALFTVDTHAAAVGIEADANSSHGIVYGARLNSTAGDDSSQSAFGIYSLTEHGGSGNIYGIRNLVYHNGATGDGYGLYTELTGSLSGDATGVYAKANVINNASSGDTYGGYFIADDDRPNGLSYGVIGEATGANNERYGVYGRAIYSGDGEPNIGIVAEAASSDYYAYGFYANVDLTTSSSDGAYGADINVDASSSSNGHLYGVNSDVTHNGAYGNTYGFRTAVQPSDNGSTYGIYASVNSTGTTGLAYAGYFNGRVEVTGPLVKGGGSFKIDHPLDPENRYLQHSFVESPDMMNVYNGNVLLDENGEAWVDLPDYFEALNRDFRYQLTCIGGFAPVYIARKIEDNQFLVAGGLSDMEVSWQVTGIRQDAWAEANRIAVEVDKEPTEQGSYLYPEAFGLDATRGVAVARDPEMAPKKVGLEKGRESMQE